MGRILTIPETERRGRGSANHQFISNMTSIKEYGAHEQLQLEKYNEDRTDDVIRRHGHDKDACAEAGIV